MAMSLPIINKIKNDTTLEKIIASSEFEDYIPSEPELPVLLLQCCRKQE
jgi:hypothetical protein